MITISRNDISCKEIQKFDPKERFITLPIERYLDIIGIEPITPQIALINAINSPNYRFITACLSRRTGKTEISNIIAHLTTLLPEQNVLLMAPNYSLSSISWDLQKKYLRMFDIETSKENAKDRVIELKNSSSIRMASVTQADSAVGRSYKLILFDEAALNNEGEDAFNIQLLPTLDKPNTKAIFISTPRRNNWFKKFYDRGFDPLQPAWCSIRSDYRENPRLDDSIVEEAKRNMSKDEFAQEYLADFTALTGAIYRIDPAQIQPLNINQLEVREIIMGLDIGFRDPTACCVVAVAPIDNEGSMGYFVLEEFQEAGLTTREIASRVHTLCKKFDVDFIYVDSAAAQLRYDFVKDFDLPTIGAKKDVNAGIACIASLVDNNRLYVDSSCKTVIHMMDNYAWDTDTKQLEKPKHDANSHMADALRYACYTHSYNI